MSSDPWRKVRIGEIANIVMGQSPESKYYNNSGNGLPFLQGNRAFGFKYPTYDTFCTNGNKFAKPNDVLLSVRAPVGDLNIAKDNICIGRGLASLSMINGNNEYLYYLLKANINKLISQESGTVYGSINRNDIYNFEVLVHDSDEKQRDFSDIFSTLDDKIDLNRQTNKTLEEIAQAIFKEWFIDFNYPGATGEMVDSPLGPIPKGWRVGTVGDVAKRVSAGKVYDFKSSLPSGTVPIIDQAHFTVIGYHNENPGVNASPENPVIVFSNHRCYTDLIQFPFSAIQNVLPFVGDEVDTRWLYHATDGIISYSEYKGHWPEFVSKPFLIPPFALTKMYGNLVKPAQILKMENQRESKMLAEMRDNLLPKLIIGEIEV